MKNNKYDTNMKIKIEQIVSESLSIAQVISKLGLRPAGGNYSTINKFIAMFAIDTSHFKGKVWNKGLRIGFKRPIEDYLSNRYPLGSDKLRRRLIKEKIFDHICSCCMLTCWNKSPIPLELDHKDGDHFNNNLSNLQLLCPNCHAQTPTYRGKNIGKMK